MEVSGTVLRRAPAVFGGEIGRDGSGLPFSGSSATGAGRRDRVSARPRSSPASGGGRFSDEGHLRYYAPQARCGGAKEEKRRAKLVKGLARDLSALQAMGFGAEAGESASGEVKRKMISEAAELLLAQLNQLKAQEKEMKKKRKEEKAAMKAATKKDCPEDDTSSESSSESSDSECEEVMEKSLVAPAEAPGAIAPPPTSESVTGGVVLQENHYHSFAKLEQARGLGDSARVVEKIEVCMGGKCKKSGAPEILEEFQRKVVGVGGAAVVGCKCMGKCKEGPNVRVVNKCEDEGEGSVKALRNPLCIGVGVGDVDSLVAKFLGDNQGMGFMAA